jgi:hypothetical protein
LARRLSAAGRAEKCYELAFLDCQVQIGDDLEITKPFGDVAELDFRHWRQPFTLPIDIRIK